MENKRVTIFVGHYGSGKTNIAVAYAKYLNSIGKSVTIADMDIVNPYFRTKDSKGELAALGIGLISSEFANSNVDLPALPSELYGVVEHKDRYAVLDIGGDDRGAYALGRFAPYILEENDYEVVFVANKYRPLTRTADEALAVMREIEAAGGIGITAIVNNSNLGELTDKETVESSVGYIEELSRLSGLPVKFTSVKSGLAKELVDFKGDLFEMSLQEKYF